MGEGLSEQQQSVATALAGDAQRTLRLCQHSTLYLSSACARGSCGLFSWPQCTHFVLTLPITAGPIVNTCLLTSSNSCSRAVPALRDHKPQPPSHVSCLLLNIIQDIAYIFHDLKASSSCQMLNSGSIPHPD